MVSAQEVLIREELWSRDIAVSQGSAASGKHGFTFSRIGPESQNLSQNQVKGKGFSQSQMEGTLLGVIVQSEFGSNMTAFCATPEKTT